MLYPDYPTMPVDPRRRRMFPDVIPAGDPYQGAPEAPRVPVYAPEPAPVADPRQQFAQNIEASVPQINARTRMAPVDLSPEDDGSYALPETTPDRTGIEKRFPSMRAAQGYSEQQDLIRPGPQSRRAMQMAETGPPVAKKGWSGRTLAFLKGLGQGGWAGAVVGAVNPQAIRNREWRTRDLPEAQRQAQIEQANQNRQLQAGDRMADLTGENPWTGEPTEPARHRMWQERESAIQHRQTNEDRDVRLKQEAQAKREMAAKNHVQAARLYRKPVDYRAVKDTSLEWLAGAVPPKDVKLEPGAMTENQKRSLDLREREFEYRRTHDAEKDQGGGLTAVQLKQLSSQFEHKKTEAHTFYNTKVAPEERMLANLRGFLERGEVLPGSKTTNNPKGIPVTPEMVSDQQEKVAQLRETSDAKLNEARALGEQHPHWTENNAGGDIDYRAMKNAPARRGGGGQPRSGHKVGDTVTIGGKTVKIGKIYPDGSFDPE